MQRDSYLETNPDPRHMLIGFSAVSMCVLSPWCDKLQCMCTSLAPSWWCMPPVACTRIPPLEALRKGHELQHSWRRKFVSWYAIYRGTVPHHLISNGSNTMWVFSPHPSHSVDYYWRCLSLELGGNVVPLVSGCRNPCLLPGRTAAKVRQG